MTLDAIFDATVDAILGRPVFTGREKQDSSQVADKKDETRTTLQIGYTGSR